MFFIGIDIAKFSHEAVVINSDGQIIQHSFNFKNSCSGYNQLLEKVRKITKDKKQLVFGMESTGHYWLALYTRLKKDGYTTFVINPLQSDALRNLDIRQSKTDSKDSLIIADVIRFGRFSETAVPHETQFALRELCRNRFFFVDAMSDMKRKVTALLDQIFPEYSSLFNDIFGQASSAVLLKYQTPEKLAHANLTSLTNMLLTYSNGYFGKAKAMELKSAAKNSFGISDPNNIFSDLIVNYMQTIEVMQEKIKLIEQKIKGIMDTLNSPITSIPGIGLILGATIISEIGDISRFSSADKLAAFAGLDPSVKQSGNFTSSRNHMSKRGSPYLRRAIWMASTIAYHSDPMFHAYYDKKSAEGLRYMNIIGHMTKKMSSVIFAVLRDNKAYTLRTS